MGTLRKYAFAILALSFLTFIALFGRLPALRSTPIGFLHRILWVLTPKFLRHVDKRVTGGSIARSSSRLGHYLVYEKHPIVMILFLSIITISAALFLSSAWSRLPSHHHLLLPLLLPLPYLFTYLCARCTASHLSPSSTTPRAFAPAAPPYPYDHILYHPGLPCRTCHLPKPARSKHCPLCRTCIAKHDHHCVWVNNCITRHNYRYFLALLASLALLLPYGAFLAHTLLAPQRLLPPPATATATATARWWWWVSGYLDSWGAAITLDKRVGAVGLLACLTAPLAVGLLAYHVYLVWAGMTTNETSKWRDLQEDMADGVVFVREWACRDGVDDVAGRGAGTSGWPVESGQVVVRTEDGEPPRFGRDGGEMYGEGGPAVWRRCWRLGELENIYDLGFWDNLMDVLFVS